MLHLFRVPYEPRPSERSFLERAETQEDNELRVTAAVLDSRESDRYFGVPLARRGIQPVWLELTNKGSATWRLRQASLDPDYYPPLEAAYVNHFRVGWRLIEFGVLAFVFIPLLVLLPFKVIGAWRANRRMNDFFTREGIGWGPLPENGTRSGFVFTSLDEGTKRFTVRLIGPQGERHFDFALTIPGLRVDHQGKLQADLQEQGPPVNCDEAALREALTQQPRATTNRLATREGDPLNLCVVGDFDTILAGFGPSWDETETINLSSCWRTAKAFIRGSRYRYSPVSPLFVDGRSQDFALQRVRQTINERMHLRLWATPLRFEGQPVWIGQVSRDIGVRFTYKTWNLTTHKIDPDVDDARDYILDALLESGRVSRVGYVGGVGPAEQSAPRHNLTGDPYFTDGQRAVAIFAETRTTPRFLGWT